MIFHFLIFLNISMVFFSSSSGESEHKENLIQSLHTQLSTFLCFNKDEKLYNYEDPNARKSMQDALILR